MSFSFPGRNKVRLYSFPPTIIISAKLLNKKRGEQMPTPHRGENHKPIVLVIP